MKTKFWCRPGAHPWMSKLLYCPACGLTQGQAKAVHELERVLIEQLGKRGYAFRGRCDSVPEDVERAFNALGICTEGHRTELAKKALGGK